MKEYNEKDIPAYVFLEEWQKEPKYQELMKQREQEEYERTHPTPREENGPRHGNKDFSDSLLDAIERSIEAVPVYLKEVKEKAKQVGYKTILITSTVLIIMGSTLGIATAKAIENASAVNDFNKNFTAATYSSNPYEKTWWYDSNDLEDYAQKVLYSNKDISAHIRFKKAYDGFKDYEKDTHFNKFLKHCHEIIAEHPEHFSDEEKEVFAFDNIYDYIEAYGFKDYETYEKEINKLIKLFAVSEKKEEAYEQKHTNSFGIQILEDSEGLNEGGR